MADLGKLNRLQLKNYKSIKTLDIELSALNILLGQNGAGKSNFINFFKLMNKLLDKDLQLYVGEQGLDRLLHFGRKVSKKLELHLEFQPNGYGAVLVPTVDDRLIFKEEYAEFFPDSISYSGGNKRKNLAEAGSNESSLPQPNTTSIAGHVSGYIADWKVYHFHDTSESASVKAPCDINDNDWLRPQAENLAAFLYAIKDTEAYLKIIRTVQRVAPFFQGFILRPDSLNSERIRLRWKHKGNDSYFDAHSLSDGTLRFICMATLLLQPHLPTIILLDEPELGLHPYAIQLLAGLMKSASHKTQVIASTQSVTLANEFGWQDIIVVQQKANASEFHRLNEEEVNLWLERYDMGDIWQKNLIGGTPSC
ncbi:MAG: putative ATPase [Pseudohongiellaceae bacterium]|jgi:predicted ATPase